MIFIIIGVLPLILLIAGTYQAIQDKKYYERQLKKWEMNK